MRYILVADDDLDIGLALRHGLANGGEYEVATATSGADAIALCAARPFDVLVCDYCLWDMDGLAIVARAHQLQPNLSAVLLTAYASWELRERASALGIVEVLAKPARLREIRRAVAEAMPLIPAVPFVSV